MTVHVRGSISTELNAKKGIWCEFCGKDCSKEHLIRVTCSRNYDERDVCIPICAACATD